MSTRRKSTQTIKTKARTKSDQAPLLHLDNLVDTVSDAMALISVACDAIARSGGSGPEATVLRLGVTALERVMDQLEKAELNLRNGIAEGGKP